MQTEHLGHMQRGKSFASLNDCIGQATRHAGIAIQPTDCLHALATIATASRPEQNVEAHRTTGNGQITNDSLAVLMVG